MPTLRNHPPVFSWREGNHFELLRDGEQFFPAMLADIAAARQLILLEMYLVETGSVADRFITALCAAAARGAAVYLILDDFGARGLRREDRMRLELGGVAVHFYNPLGYAQWRRNFMRDHRKLLVVDGRIAYTGGAGLADQFAPADARPAWRETMVRITGPVVSDWQALFSAAWERGTGRAIALAPIGTLAQGKEWGRVSHNHGMQQRDISRNALNRVRNAQHRVWLATAYFVPPLKLRRALRRAAWRGVDVRLLLPGPHTDHPAVRHAGRRFYAGLLRQGVRIFEYQPRFTHSKMLLCDDWSSIGSSNIDRWTLRWNLEANQEIDSATTAAAARRMLEQDFAQCAELSWQTWPHRPWYRRGLETFWGWVDRALERWLNRGKPPLPGRHDHD